MRGVLQEKSALSSIKEAKQVLSSSIDKTTGAYEQLNMEKGGLTEAAGTVAAESSETIDFIIANFEEASSELANSSEALLNIAEDMSTLHELDADAKTVSDTFEEYVKDTLNSLEVIGSEISNQGKIISDVAEKTGLAADEAQNLADKVEAALEIKYNSKKAALQAKQQAANYAASAMGAYENALKAGDDAKAALCEAVKLKNTAEEKVDDARIIYNKALVKNGLAKDELDIILAENGLSGHSKGLNGDIKLAVDYAQSALAKANEAANIAAIDLIGRQYELAEAEGKLAVAEARKENAQNEAIESLRNVLNKTVIAIQATNESAITAKEAVNQAYESVKESAEEMRQISLQAELDMRDLELAKAKRDEARRVYVEALESKSIAEYNVDRAKEAAQRAQKLLGREFNYSSLGGLRQTSPERSSIIGNAITSLFGSKNKNNKKRAM